MTRRVRTVRHNGRHIVRLDWQAIHLTWASPYNSALNWAPREPLSPRICADIVNLVNKFSPCHSTKSSL